MMKMKVNKKIAGASAMLMLSATMLGTSTFAWFTMNKEVSVTGMEVKAHAEEGLLINEVKAIGSNTWDEAATANSTAPTTVVLRPASTADMATFWHANSKKSYDEAGIGELDDTVTLEGGGKFLNVTFGETGIEDNVVVGAENAASDPKATGNTLAETHIYYKDASFGGDDTTYQDGEGFYVKYTYYLKSSGDTDLVVNDLQAQVKATKKTTDPAGTSTNLEKSLRVGIAVPASNESSTINGYKIFAPVNGADTSYGVTGDAAGTAADVVTVTPVVLASGTDTGAFTPYTKLNLLESGTTYKNITIPNVNNANGGLPVYVYVWFEGEDTNCMSDNLTSVLSTYDIDIQFKDAAIY